MVLTSWEDTESVSSSNCNRQQIVSLGALLRFATGRRTDRLAGHAKDIGLLNVAYTYIGQQGYLAKTASMHQSPTSHVGELGE